MPIADRLSALAGPDVRIDVDAGLTQVRQQAHRARRRRTALLSVAALALAVAAVSTVDLDGTERVATVPELREVPRLLPDLVPSDFALAWYDQLGIGAAEDRDPPWSNLGYDLSFGYHAEVDGGVVELEVLVFWEAELSDPERAAEVMGGDVLVIGGRPAAGVVLPDQVQVVAEIDRAVVRVQVFSLSDTAELLRPVTLDEVEDLVTSIRPVDDAEWPARVAGADVVTDVSQLDFHETEILLEGDGWRLSYGESRSPRAVTRPAIGFELGGTWTAVGDDLPPEHRDLLVSGTRTIWDGRQVVWGIAPPETVRAEVVVDGDRAHEAEVVPIDGLTVFAVDLTGVDGTKWEYQTYDRDGVRSPRQPVDDDHRD